MVTHSYDLDHMVSPPLLVSSLQADIGRRGRMKLIGWGLVALLVASAAWARGATTHDRAEHSTMHAGMHAAASLPNEAGQGAFAAIAEVVLLLQADPRRTGQRSMSARCASTWST
jgi:hypothetical protein